MPGNGAGQEMWGKEELRFGQAKCVVPGGQPGRGSGRRLGLRAALFHDTLSSQSEPETRSSCLVSKATLLLLRPKSPESPFTFCHSPHPIHQQNIMDLPSKCTQNLATTLSLTRTISHLDHPCFFLQPKQLILNTAARGIVIGLKADHAPPVLRTMQVSPQSYAKLK